MSIWTIAALTLLLAAPVQRIETQYPDRGTVTRVETATNHLTVLELAEPVTLAAAGSPLFRIERRENKVFIQPLEEGAWTNLFVWTASGRWTYELAPARSPETTHFAIDQAAAVMSHAPDAVVPNADDSEFDAFQAFAGEMLFLGRPIQRTGVPQAAGVSVAVTDVLRKDDQLFVRYVIDNRSPRPFTAGPPEVFHLESAYSSVSLHAFRYSQLGPDLERRVRPQNATPVVVLDCEWPPEAIFSGQWATGILTLYLPETSSEPIVLRFAFPADGEEPLALTLVL